MPLPWLKVMPNRPYEGTTWFWKPLTIRCRHSTQMPRCAAEENASIAKYLGVGREAACATPHHHAFLVFKTNSN